MDNKQKKLMSEPGAYMVEETALETLFVSLGNRLMSGLGS